MNNRFLELLVIIFILWVLAGCSNKATIQNNPSSVQPKQIKTASVMKASKNVTKDTINEFFFQNISTKKTIRL
jgi:predicted small lipoprotein YifL